MTSQHKIISRTRKMHRCDICDRKIPKGFSAHFYTGINNEGEFFNCYICNTCNTLYEVKLDNGHYYQLYEDEMIKEIKEMRTLRSTLMRNFVSCMSAVQDAGKDSILSRRRANTPCPVFWIL